MEKLNLNDEKPNKKRQKSFNTPGVLRKMQSLSVGSKWDFDGIYDDFFSYDDKKPYEYTFNQILGKMKVENFAELAQTIFEGNESKPIRVLDLFGGAYFLTDLTDVSEIIGARLENIDAKLLSLFTYIRDSYNKTLTHYENDDDDDIKKIKKELKDIEKFVTLIKNTKRRLILGNLYNSKIWKKLKDEKQDGFDLIVCRPEGPFKNSSFVSTWSMDYSGEKIGKIFYALLKRTMRLLKANGIAFIQFPKITMDDFFWVKFMNDNKEFRFTFDTQDYRGSSCCAIKRLEKPLNQ